MTYVIVVLSYFLIIVTLLRISLYAYSHQTAASTPFKRMKNGGKLNKAANDDNL